MCRCGREGTSGRLSGLGGLGVAVSISVVGVKRGKAEEEGKERTINILRHFHTHLNQLQLINLPFKVPHESLKHVYPVRRRKWVVEELEELLRELMP
jgi:hypothetical protein